MMYKSMYAPAIFVSCKTFLKKLKSLRWFMNIYPLFCKSEVKDICLVNLN